MSEKKEKEIEFTDSFRELIISKRFVSSNQTACDEKEKIFLPYKRKNLLNLNDFFERLMKMVSIKGTILPRNCRYVDSRDNGYKILVIEDPPAVRNILVDMDFENTKERFKITGKDQIVEVKDLIGEKRPYRMNLSFPYVVYMLMFNHENRFSRMKVFYRLSPMSSAHDYLLLANLPNIGGSQTVCLGDLHQQYSNLSDGANLVIDSFWFNSFNTDYISNYQSYAKEVPEFKDFVSWAYNTVVDPMFIFSVKYFKNDRTVEQECNQFFKEHSPQAETNNNTIHDFLNRLLSPSKVVVDGKLLTSRAGTTESYYFKEKPVSIGDIINYDKSDYYINDIIIDSNTGIPSYFSLEDKEGKLRTVEISKVNQSQFEIKYPVIECLQLADGSEVKIGDAVVLQYPFKKVRTIEKIRMGRDGNPEVLLKGDTDYYLLDKIGATKLGDIIPQLSGIKLNKDDAYILYRKTDDVFKYFANVKYDSYEISTEGYIILKFNETNMQAGQSARKWRIYDSSVEHHQDEWQLHLKSDVKLLENRTFRILNKLYQNKNKDIYLVKDAVIFDERKYAGVVPSYNHEEAINDILTEKGTRLFIPSYDVDIDFSVGDTVIVADWDNLYCMVTPRVIHAFIYENQCLFVLTIDPDTGAMRKDKYIDFKNNIVYVGSIRKIDLNVKNLENGTLIVAQEAWIQNFPKKDVNKIVGVITDTVTHPPLVLCSNGLTIWADELNQFKLIKKGARGYKSLFEKIVPVVNPKDLKDQLGDLYIHTDSGNKVDTILFSKTTPQDYGHKAYTYLISTSYILTRNDYNARNSLNLNATPEAFEKFKVKRYGIIRPRYSERRKSVESMINAYPNLLGGHISSIRQFRLYQK